MLTTIKIYFRLLINQSASKTTETTNRMIFTETKILVHFYKKIPAHHHHFPWLSMTLAVFHNFPGLENGLTKFHDFPGRVLTLIITINTRSLKSELKPGCLVWVHNSLQTNTHSQLLTLETTAKLCLYYTMSNATVLLCHLSSTCPSLRIHYAHYNKSVEFTKMQKEHEAQSLQSNHATPSGHLIILLT